MATALEEVRRACDLAVASAAGGPLEAAVADVRARLDGPLRVAIAGRVKAGKSTLLNALVGERLAPTDAGECTKVVTWYREGLGYEINARLRGGGERPLPFERVDGALHVGLGGLDEQAIDRIDVQWPSSALREITLVDTPGLLSLEDANSLHTREFLAFGEGRPSDADAVIYLMRHMHRRDAEFLGAFMDRSITSSSPVNAVVVLSRADEIGAGRLDAMVSSTRIAARYQADPQLRHLCSAVVPVAGLLAETGLTLREHELAALKALLATPEADLERMLLSVATFTDPRLSGLTVEQRRDLLDRLGLFGLRFSVDALRSGRVTTATELSRALVQESGFEGLRRLIAEHFLPRAKLLKARSALVALRALATGPLASLAPELERIEASTLEFTHLRLAHLVRSGEVALEPDEVTELDRVVAPELPLAARLGLDPDAPPPALVAAALAGVERWRVRSEQPLTGTALAEVCSALERTYESLYLQAAAPSG